MQNITGPVIGKHLRNQRKIIETFIKQLKSLCIIEHSRHRKLDGFLTQRWPATQHLNINSKANLMSKLGINRMT